MIQPGTEVIHGTLRSSDLIVAFMDVLFEYDRETYDEIVYRDSEDRPFYTWARANERELIQDDEPEGLDYFLHERLWDALDRLAPTGCYFGATEGDGSCFGFWYANEDEE